MTIALIGHGYWGRNVARELKPDAIYDVDTDYRTIEADAVAICTPSPTHCDIAKHFLERGVSCFVEKPLCLHTHEAEDLVATARNSGAVLMVGHLMLYHPAVRWIADNIDSFGDIRYITCTRTNLGIVRTAESAFDSLAPHDVSMVLHLLGERPTSVKAVGHRFLGSVHDVVFADLGFASGRAAHIHASWLDPQKRRQMTVVGSKRMAVVDGDTLTVHDRTIASGHPSGDSHVPALTTESPLAIEMQHFRDCLNGAKPLTDGADAVEVVRVMEEVRACLES